MKHKMKICVKDNNIVAKLDTLCKLLSEFHSVSRQFLGNTFKQQNFKDAICQQALEYMKTLPEIQRCSRLDAALKQWRLLPVSSLKKAGSIMVTVELALFADIRTKYIDDISRLDISAISEEVLILTKGNIFQLEECEFRSSWDESTYDIALLAIALTSYYLHLKELSEGAGNQKTESPEIYI